MTALPLVLTLVGVTGAAFAAFWGLSLFAQKYLYSEPADKLVLRAAVAGLLLGCFVTLWVYINTRAGGNRYAAIHQFEPFQTLPPADTFEAVHTLPPGRTPNTLTRTYERVNTPTGQQYLSVPDANTPDRKPLRFMSPDSMITAITLTDPATKAPVKFEAVLVNGRFGGEKFRFQEVGGGRTIEVSQEAKDPPVAVTVPSGGVVFLAVLLNVLHLVVWVVCFWPVLRFGLWHAVGLAVVFCAAFTLLIMPMLFDANKVQVPV